MYIAKSLIPYTFIGQLHEKIADEEGVYNLSIRIPNPELAVIRNDEDEVEETLSENVISCQMNMKQYVKLLNHIEDIKTIDDIKMHLG